jgi:hypothetical protein
VGTLQGQAGAYRASAHRGKLGQREEESELEAPVSELAPDVAVRFYVADEATLRAGARQLDLLAG